MMEDKTLIHALIERHHVMAGVVQNLKDQLRVAISDLATIDAAIRMIDPGANPNLTIPRRPRENAAAPGK